MINKESSTSKREKLLPASLCQELAALPGLTEGRAECFVDRRRDLQSSFPLCEREGRRL